MTVFDSFMFEFDHKRKYMNIFVLPTGYSTLYRYKIRELQLFHQKNISYKVYLFIFQEDNEPH